MNEFSLISTYFAPLTGGNKAALNLQDDAALISPTSGKQLVITTDAMTENVHFFSGDDPYNLARKLLRVNLSDVASMGATALYYLLTCIFPRTTTEGWIQQFTEGLKADNKEFGVVLLGGDTVSQSGPLTLSLTAIGQVPDGKALTRAGAKPGEDVYVSGTIGDAALALQLLKNAIPSPSAECSASLISRYHLPHPRMLLGKALLELASSAMDISDGLLQDAGHIARNSHVQLALDAEKIPLSDAGKTMLAIHPHLFVTIVTGGDDYELLFTLPACYREELHSIAKTTGTVLTRIGCVKTGTGVILYDRHGQEMMLGRAGYQHF